MPLPPDAACFTLPRPSGGAAEHSVGAEAEAFEAAQLSHARYGSGALRAAVFGFSGAVLADARHGAAS